MMKFVILTNFNDFGTNTLNFHNKFFGFNSNILSFDLVYIF
jgi:hypothetical protein